MRWNSFYRWRNWGSGTPELALQSQLYVSPPKWVHIQSFHVENRSQPQWEYLYHTNWQMLQIGAYLHTLLPTQPQEIQFTSPPPRASCKLTSLPKGAQQGCGRAGTLTQGCLISQPELLTIGLYCKARFSVAHSLLGWRRKKLPQVWSTGCWQSVRDPYPEALCLDGWRGMLQEHFLDLALFQWLRLPCCF